MVCVVGQYTGTSPTFERMKELWNSGAANDFVLRDAMQLIGEDAMLRTFEQLASGASPRHDDPMFRVGLCFQFLLLDRWRKH